MALIGEAGAGLAAGADGPAVEDRGPACDRRQGAEPAGGGLTPIPARPALAPAAVTPPGRLGHERAEAAAAFLAAAGWSGAVRVALAGDASGRRYERLSLSGRTAVLMDAPPPPATADAAAPGGTRSFVAVAGLLRAMGLSPPGILAADVPGGLLLLEDLGDALLARLAEAQPAREPALYEAAAEVLVRIGAEGPPDGLPLFDAAAMTEATRAAGPLYAGHDDAPWLPALRAALDAHAGPADTLILRDYHAENLIWLPERVGPARLGLLDFQDAMRGPAAYDLASLLSDVRREVSPAAAAAAVARYAALTGARGLDAALAVLGAQRSLRILAVLARLSRTRGPHYAGYLPRAWGHLSACLAHPACEALRGPVLGALPPPEAAARLP